MKKFRLSVAFLLLALILAIVPGVFAQDETFGLSQTDYDLWTSANENSAAFDSLSYDFTATFSAVGLSDTDASANLTGTGVIAQNDGNPMFQLDVSGTMTDGTQSQDVSLGVRIVDGYLYVNDGSGWQGSTLEDALGEASSMFGQGLTDSGADIDPAQIESGDLSGLAGMEGVGDAMNAFSDLDPAEFVSLVRSDVDGAAMFTLNFDLGKLLSSPALAPLFAGAMGGGSTEGMTDDQIQQMGMMMGMMFGTATISLDQYVDTSSSMVDRTSLNVNLPLDNMVGPGAGISLNFDINLSGYNEPVSVEAPADVKMMDMSGS